MKKVFKNPEIVFKSFKNINVLTSSSTSHKPNDKWDYNDDGELINPGGHVVPGHKH